MVSFLIRTFLIFHSEPYVANRILFLKFGRSNGILNDERGVGNYGVGVFDLDDSIFYMDLSGFNQLLIFDEFVAIVDSDIVNIPVCMFYFHQMFMVYRFIQKF
jgi:hypothetical protein